VVFYYFNEEKMKISIATNEVNGVIEPEHRIEILCPQCDRDINESEMAAQKCNDCGADLSTPKQHMEIMATSIPLTSFTLNGG
jgi:Zn finger protein HypA/HybF involved in hydrogenase expression